LIKTHCALLVDVDIRGAATIGSVENSLSNHSGVGGQTNPQTQRSAHTIDG
jgi:hypothetical protein